MEFTLKIVALACLNLKFNKDSPCEKFFTVRYFRSGFKPKQYLLFKQMLKYMR